MTFTLNQVALDFVISSLARDASVSAEVTARVRKMSFIEREGCHFLDSLLNDCKSVHKSAFPDETGYECFVNHLHIDEPTVNGGVLTAIAILCELDRKWRSSKFRDLDLCHIVSCDPESGESVYRCHVARPGQRWLGENIDRYPEMIITAGCPE